MDWWAFAKVSPDTLLEAQIAGSMIWYDSGAFPRMVDDHHHVSAH